MAPPVRNAVLLMNDAFVGEVKEIEEDESTYIAPP